MKLRLPDTAHIRCEDSSPLPTEGNLTLNYENGTVTVSLHSKDAPVSFVTLRWNFTEDEKRKTPVHVCGDAWERGYGTLQWQGIVPDLKMPWYFLVSDGSDTVADPSGRLTEGFGVKVRPAAFAAWQYDVAGITLTLDVRCGTKGVLLGDRTLTLCEIIFSEFENVSAFEAGKRFCRQMCTDPRLPKAPVYGYNNWYYAYGKFTEKEVVADAKRLGEICKDFSAKPYMVIDAGWAVDPCDGCWIKGNDLFPDMAELAKKIEDCGAIPGIWIRPLYAGKESKIPEDWRFPNRREFFDPTIPVVKNHIAKMFENLVAEGYKLIKFDFVTYDIFGKWGFAMPQFPASGDFTFHDRTKTSAEVVLDFYRLVREASGDAILIGCNTISHLCAGIVELNRTGDDTSGREWERTRKMGVNTLAFRLMQNGAFYMADADCVGLTENVPWEQNKQWLKILSESGSPLFISWNPKFDSEEISNAVAEALKTNSTQSDALVPLDWMENNNPARWTLNGTPVSFSWHRTE